MKPAKRLKQSLADLEANGKKEHLRQWLRRQPGSFRRGYERGRLVISYRP